MRTTLDPYWINATFSSLAAIYPFTRSIATRGNVKTCPSVWCWFGSSVNEGARDINPNSRRRIKANSYSSAAQSEPGWQSSCEPPFPLSQSWVVHFCTASNGSRYASFTHPQWLRDPQQWACEWWCRWTMVQPCLIEHSFTATMVTQPFFSLPNRAKMDNITREGCYFFPFFSFLFFWVGILTGLAVRGAEFEIEWNSTWFMNIGFS